jgi:hypothetical protein
MRPQNEPEYLIGLRTGVRPPLRDPHRGRRRAAVCARRAGNHARQTDFEHLRANGHVSQTDFERRLRASRQSTGRHIADAWRNKEGRHYWQSSRPQTKTQKRIAVN